MFMLIILGSKMIQGRIEGNFRSTKGSFVFRGVHSSRNMAITLEFPVVYVLQLGASHDPKYYNDKSFQLFLI